MTMEIATQVCVIGGGPAGLMLGLALAEHGCETVVLEQSAGFARSFRGESISPDSAWLLQRHGALDTLSARDRLEVHRMRLHERGEPVLSVDFSEFDYPQR